MVEDIKFSLLLYCDILHNIFLFGSKILMFSVHIILYLIRACVESVQIILNLRPRQNCGGG